MKTQRFLGFWAAVALGVAATGCDDDAPTTHHDDHGADGEEDDATRSLTYHRDVAPILAEHCLGCHTDGAIAPFPLTTYDQVLELAPVIDMVMAARTMPPPGVVADGSCNEFRNVEWVPDAQLELIHRWVDDGALEGEPDGPPPEPAPRPTLEGPTITAKLPRYLPTPDVEAPYEDYQCFLAPLDIDAPTYLTGFDVVPGNAEVVHHVLGFKIDPQANAERIAELDGESPDRPGWDCYGAGGEGLAIEGLLLGWAPGQGAGGFGNEVGYYVEPGDAVLVQVHYNLLDAEGEDETKILFQTADTVERELMAALPDPFLFSGQFGGEPAVLEPGRESVTYEWTLPVRQALAFTFSPVDDWESIDLLGIAPHMHTRGRSLSLTLHTGEGDACGAQIDTWDFDWQRMYIYDDPPRLKGSDEITVRCTYDTSEDETAITPGFGTDDEMCLVGLVAAIAE